MAERDIMPYTAGANGSHARVLTCLADGAAAFLHGEPVTIEADGQMIEAADNPVIDADVPGAVGIAAVGAADIASLRGTLTNQMVSYYPFDYETEFKTKNVFTTGAAIVAASTLVGDSVGLKVVGGAWGVQTDGAALAESFIITRVLNDQGVDVNLPGAASAANTVAGQGAVVFKRNRFDAA